MDPLHISDKNSDEVGDFELKESKISKKNYDDSESDVSESINQKSEIVECLEGI